MINIAMGQAVRYLGPYDVCAGYDDHLYKNKIGTVIAVMPETPPPLGPITIQFSDGFRVTATESEVKDPSLAY